MTTNELKEYLQKIYVLEGMQYEQNMLCQRISGTIERINNTPLKAMKPLKSIFDIIDNLYEITISSTVCGGLLGAFIVVFLFNLGSGSSGQKIQVGLLCASGAILVLAFLYWKDVARVNKQIRKENREIAIQNAADALAMDEQVENLKQDLQVARNGLYQTQQTLQAFYNKNVIYPKYRNFIAVSSFYEYLASGRCTTLQGHEGAYNIYENEIRLNMILVKLDEIIYRLDEIKDNQYMLYSAINTANSHANRIFNSLQQIGDNTSIIAYNSKITAQNTEYLKWVEYFKY